MVNQFDKQSESTETGPEQTSKEEQAAGAQDCHASQSISGDASMVHECGSVSRLELGFLVLASFFAAGLALFYMQGEDALYWSDYNYYRYMTWFLKEQVLTNPLSTPLLVFVSTGLMYNFFFALPLLPFAIVFGDSRSVFIASMAAVYLAPFAFMLGIIARQTIKSELAAPRRLALYAGAGLALTIPTLWAPVLRGYPDHGSAMFVLLAMILYIKNRARLSAKSIVLIGLCLGLAPLLRRHFFYLSFSFAAAMLIHQVYLARISSLSPMQFVRGPLCRWCSVGVTSALLLLTVGFLFVNSMLTSDFLTLYKSAYVSAFEGFVYFYQAFGGLVLLFSVAGFFLAIKSKMLDKSTAVLVFSFSLISFFVWPIFGRHVAIHYTIYAAPLVVLGNVFLLLYLGTRSSRMAKAAACALFLFQLANFSIGLMPESVVSRLPFTPARFGMLTVALAEPEPAGLSLILSANYAPQVRHDFSEMERLFAYLLKEGGKGPVFVSTSNHILAGDILRNCQRRQTGDLRLNSLVVFEGPILDSRDSLPIEGLLSCRFVLVPSPLVSMYKPESSTIQALTGQCFEKNWPLSLDFEKVPETFLLDGDTTVSVYRRLRPSPASSAVVTLEKMKAAMPESTNGQPDWISTDEVYDSQDKQSRKSLLIRTVESKTERDHYVLSSEPVSGSYFLQASIQNSPNNLCGFLLEYYSPAGKRLSESPDAVIAIENGELSYSGQLSEAAYIVLYLIGPEQSEPLILTFERN